MMFLRTFSPLSAIVAPKPLLPRVVEGIFRIGPQLRRAQTGRGLTPLNKMSPGTPACIGDMLGLDHDVVEWLRAVGIEKGGSVIVLRRALFGGPIHIRCSSGGEFALDSALASVIVVSYEADAA